MKNPLQRMIFPGRVRHSKTPETPEKPTPNHAHAKNAQLGCIKGSKTRFANTEKVLS